MESGDPIERRGAVIPDAPLLRQLGHRVQLVLDHAQVAVIDRVSGADASCWQAPRTNPSADSLGVPTQPIGSLSDSQHVEDATPSCRPQTPSPSMIGDQQRPTTTNHVHVDASADFRGSLSARQQASCMTTLASLISTREAFSKASAIKLRCWPRTGRAGRRWQCCRWRPRGAGVAGFAAGGYRGSRGPL